MAETVRAVASATLYALDLEERGLVFRDVVACGIHAELPFEISFKQHRTQNGGIQPFTAITLQADAAGAPIRLGGAHWSYLAQEAHVPFPQESLADFHLAGAPRALLETLANGSLGERLAMLTEAGSSIVSLETGPCARRAGSARGGIKLVVRGWPSDPSSLAFLLDTVAELRHAIHASVPVLAGRGATTLASHPEVVDHELALCHSRDNGRFVVATLVASFVAGIGVSFAHLLFA